MRSLARLGLLALLAVGCSTRSFGEYSAEWRDDVSVAVDASHADTHVASDTSAPAIDTATEDTTVVAVDTQPPPDTRIAPPEVAPEVETCNPAACTAERGPYSQCAAGACTCLTGAITCGLSKTCVRTQDDPNNCGGCGTKCDGSQYCVLGTCTCRPGFTACKSYTTTAGTFVPCSSRCMDMEGGDASHCSGNLLCTLGKCWGGGCQSSATSCPSGHTDCPLPGYGSRSCFDLERDSNHCRSCTTSCTADQACLAGIGCTQYFTTLDCAECDKLFGATTHTCCTSSAWGTHPLCVLGSKCPASS